MTRLNGILVAVLCAAPLTIRADAPTASIFTASDLPRLAEGLNLPAGKYYVAVWAPARDHWALSAGEGSVTLGAHPQGNGGRPSWSVLGPIEVKSDGVVKIAIAGMPKPSGPSVDAHDAGKQSKVIVPALIALSSAAELAAPNAAIDIIRGRADTIEPLDDVRREKVRSNKEGAHFDPPATAQGWNDRARAVREQMRVALGLWPQPPRTPLNARVFGKVERDGYTIEKVVLETMPGFYLAGNLYRPSAVQGKVPALLIPHGHWAEGRVNEASQMRSVRWAKLGCLAFSYDMVGYADSKPFGHSFLNARLDRWGLSLATLQTINSIRVVDWLTSLPDGDATRIGCTGESGGGTQTFLLTAIEPRIAVAAPIVMVSDHFQGGCVCENSAGLRIGTDNVEFAAMCAPRPMKLVGATGDWSARTMTNAYPAIRHVYELVGCPDRVSADVFDFPHNYNQTTRNAVYAFMAPWLLGIDPSQTKEGEQKLEKPEDLYCYTADHPAPADMKKPEQIEEDLISLQNKWLDEAKPAVDRSAQWQDARPRLAVAHRVRTGVVEPTSYQVEAAQLRRVNRSGLTIIHLDIDQKATGEHISAVELVPDRATGQVTVVFSARGKAGLVDSQTGDPAPLVKALLEKGQMVIGFDPLLVGESVDPTAYADQRPDTIHYETYNKVLAADRMQDLAVVLAWAKADRGVRQVNLVAEGHAGALALLARPLLTDLGRTVIDLDGVDYGDGKEAVPTDLDLPGVLQFGGLKSAAALVAPAPLWIARPRGDDVKQWAEAAFALNDSKGQLRVSAEKPTVESIAAWLVDGTEK